MRKRALVATVAGVPAVLYLLYVFHYSVNVPWGFDDWAIVPLVNAANHGHFSLGMLWPQYGDRRLVISRLITVAFGDYGSLNERAVMMFTAALFVASYVVFLSLFRDYLGRRLTWLAVLVVGVVWFSLTDWFAALWSFQLSWYLVLVFFVAMVALLQRRGLVLFALAIASAVLASLSDISGFVLWPVGLICLLWHPRRREVVAWLTAAVVTVGVYFHGYNFGYRQCPDCTASFDFRHPVLVAKFAAGLVGAIVPTVGTPGVPHWVGGWDFGLHQLLGVVILLAAGYVVVQSVRDRRQTTPLPVVLVAFGVLFDLVIAEGRTGEGVIATTGSYYTMPNLILLLGIVVYAWRHLPDLRRDRSWRALAAGVLVVFLAIQTFMATGNGITAGRDRHQELKNAALVVANLHRLPVATRDCDLDVFVGFVSSEITLYFDPWYAMAVQDHLSLLGSSAALRQYRAEGLPQTACGK